jgi:hypothetical protein
VDVFSVAELGDYHSVDYTASKVRGWYYNWFYVACSKNVVQVRRIITEERTAKGKHIEQQLK